jgi:hypothetical protein
MIKDYGPSVVRHIRTRRLKNPIVAVMAIPELWHSIQMRVVHAELQDRRLDLERTEGASATDPAVFSLPSGFSWPSQAILSNLVGNPDGASDHDAASSVNRAVSDSDIARRLSQAKAEMRGPPPLCTGGIFKFSC